MTNYHDFQTAAARLHGIQRPSRLRQSVEWLAMVLVLTAVVCFLGSLG